MKVTHDVLLTPRQKAKELYQLELYLMKFYAGVQYAVTSAKLSL
jgi:hypothetical protein